MDWVLQFVLMDFALPFLLGTGAAALWGWLCFGRSGEQ